jgi:hypothetical protein
MAKQNKEIFYPGDLVECKTNSFGSYNIIKEKQYIVISTEKDNIGVHTQWLGIKCESPNNKISTGEKPNWGSRAFKLVSRSKAGKILFGDKDDF